MTPSSLPSWFTEALKDTTITDFCINGSHSAYIDRGYGFEKISHFEKNPISDEELKTWIISELSSIGKTWDAKHPFIDGSLPSGHRIHVIFPPINSNGILVSLRRLPSYHDKKKIKWNNQPLFQKLIELIQAGDSILISGATGSGKTTLANDLLEHVPHSERIIALEDTQELAPSHPHFLSLVSRPANADGFGEITLRMLLKQTLRMRPDRIILGECRGTEILELLQALNTGHRGSMTTLHANSPRDALRRVELLCLLAAGGSIPISAIRELLSIGVQWVIQVKQEGYNRKISELWKIEGREGDTILMRPMVDFFLR